MTIATPPSKTDNEAQSLRTTVGRRFEGYVTRAINGTLNREEIYAVNLKQLNDLIRRDSSFKEVLEFAKMPMQNPCDQRYDMMLPDTDVLVYYGQRDGAGFVKKRCHLATISCKVSFHGRETESTFWAKALRNHGAKFFLATEDKFNELKTCENGNKVRRLVESFMDSTYLMNQYESSSNSLEKDVAKFFEILEDSKQTGYQRQSTRIFDSRRNENGYCKRVRPFDDLLFDLMQLKFESRR
ncbi:MAG: hypothetical protein HY619_07520 [Thaumarchaeota archaeon]|nr:hypothetical protein [Nitrososphaerota archaeon]